MECHDCNIRPVCKIYDAIQPHMHMVNITLSNCTVKNAGTIAAPIPVPAEQPLRAERRPEEIAEISEQIRNLSQPEQEDQRSYAECVDCGESYETNEFTRCMDCAKDMCVHCAIRANKKVVCEECYHK